MGEEVRTSSVYKTRGRLGRKSLGEKVRTSSAYKPRG